jgi:lysophospholipase L1-like esterase
MANWVKSNPPLASADHTHFNSEGSKKVGEMIAQALLDAYYNNK